MYRPLGYAHSLLILLSHAISMADDSLHITGFMQSFVRKNVYFLSTWVEYRRQRVSDHVY